MNVQSAAITLGAVAGVAGFIGATAFAQSQATPDEKMMATLGASVAVGAVGGTLMGLGELYKAAGSATIATHATHIGAGLAIGATAAFFTNFFIAGFGGGPPR